MKIYYSGIQLLSHSNAVFYFINTTRNYGKTWNFKYRAVKRAVKKGKKTLWIRRFKKEVKQCIKSFFKSKDLQTFCDVSFYNKETNPCGNLKLLGDTFYIKKGKKWIDFLQVVALSDVNNIRSSDDVDIDTIVFDEYTTTPNKYRAYRGNEVTDFIDIFISIKRNHCVKCIFLGNKESINNPYFNYFGIAPPPNNFDGFKRYKKDSIIVEQHNKLNRCETKFEAQVENLLKGTPYGDYLYGSVYKVQTKNKLSKVPPNARCYVQFNFTQPLAIYQYNDLFYITGKINNSYPIYSQNLSNKFANEKQLFNRHKRYFSSLINAISDNRIYFDSNQIAESFLIIKKWLGAI